MNTKKYYDYNEILCDVLINVVTPTLCRACENAAVQKHGEISGPYRMQLVLETYPAWKEIKHSWYYCGEINVDFATVMYLYFPTQGTRFENNGVIREVAELYGLNECQKRRILDLRKIRNNVVHNCSMGVDLDGHLEREAMDMIENALYVLDGSIHSKLQEYRKRLEEVVINRTQQ